MTTEPQIAVEPVTDEDARVATQTYFINMKQILAEDRRRVAERQAARIADQPMSDYEIGHMEGAEMVVGTMGAEIERLRAEVARLTAANGWRPIETAPKDGKRVLLSWPSTLVTVGQISNLRAGAGWPTHWMPLPEPPKENSNG